MRILYYLINDTLYSRDGQWWKVDTMNWKISGFNNFLISSTKSDTLNLWKFMKIYKFYSDKKILFKNIS